jgi:hypothetical protein
MIEDTDIQRKFKIYTIIEDKMGGHKLYPVENHQIFSSLNDAIEWIKDIGERQTDLIVLEMFWKP